MIRPAIHAALEAELAFAAAQLELGAPAASIIQQFVDEGAKLNHRAGANILTWCGITGTCTSSPSTGLLQSWMRCAARRISLDQAGASA